MKVYLIGSLRNPVVPEVAGKLRQAGVDCFDDWYSAGPEADDKWKEYEQGRGHNYLQALDGLAAGHVYEFDKLHLDQSDAVVLLLPAGKSGHLELGYSIGRGKPGYILLDSPDRWDVMYKFATKVFDKVDELVEKLTEEPLKWVNLEDQSWGYMTDLKPMGATSTFGICWYCGLNKGLSTICSLCGRN